MDKTLFQMGQKTESVSISDDFKSSFKNGRQKNLEKKGSNTDYSDEEIKKKEIKYYLTKETYIWGE